MNQELGQCPFTKQKCIGERCQIWQQLPFAASGPLVGFVRTGVMTGCSITLTAFFLGRLNALATPPGLGPHQPAG